MKPVLLTVDQHFSTSHPTMTTLFDTEPIAIKRVYGMTGSKFNTLYKNKQPVILTGIMKDWLPMETWTEEYIEGVLYEIFGDKLTVLQSHDNEHFINHPDVTDKVDITVKHLIDSVFCRVYSTEVPIKYYLRTHSMPQRLYDDLIVQKQVTSLITAIIDVDNHHEFLSKKQLPDTTSKVVQDISPWEEFLDYEHAPVGGSLEEEVINEHVKQAETSPVLSGVTMPYNLPHQYQEMFNKIFKSQTMQLWIGTSGNVTPLHFDRNHGLLVQIIGRKQLILFSHMDSSYLYSYPSYTPRSHTSRVNLRDHDACADRFPRLRHAQRYTCVLNAGEILYMPPFWWHDVTSLDGCVSVTLPWDVNVDEIPLNMLL